MSVSLVATPENFHRSAKMVVEIFREEFQEELLFNRDGVVALSRYIEEIRPLLNLENREQAITMLGAFLGECLIAHTVGAWTNSHGFWEIVVTEGVSACPFLQIESQIQDGLEQSVVRYFDCVIQLDQSIHMANLQYPQNLMRRTA